MTVQKDLEIIRRTQQATDTLLHLLPAAEKALGRLEKAGYPGAEMTAEMIYDDRCDAILRSHVQMANEHLARWLAADGDLGKWTFLMYTEDLGTDVDTAIKELKADGDQRTLSALLSYVGRAS